MFLFIKWIEINILLRNELGNTASAQLGNLAWEPSFGTYLGNSASAQLGHLARKPSFGTHLGNPA